jgi:hypothetical protein
MAMVMITRMVRMDLTTRIAMTMAILRMAMIIPMVAMTTPMAMTIRMVRTVVITPVAILILMMDHNPIAMIMRSMVIRTNI